MEPYLYNLYFSETNNLYYNCHSPKYIYHCIYLYPYCHLLTSTTFIMVYNKAAKLKSMAEPFDVTSEAGKHSVEIRRSYAAESMKSGKIVKKVIESETKYGITIKMIENALEKFEGVTLSEFLRLKENLLGEKGLKRNVFLSSNIRCSAITVKLRKSVVYSVLGQQTTFVKQDIKNVQIRITVFIPLIKRMK